MQHNPRTTLPPYRAQPGDHTDVEWSYRLLIRVLRHLTDQKGLDETAAAANMTRGELRYVLRYGGNPTLDQLTAIAFAHGVRLCIELRQPTAPVDG